MTNFELAQTLVRLGRRPRDGARRRRLVDVRVRGPGPEPALRRARAAGVERADAAVLRRVPPPPAESVVSPNGDGVAETQELAFKVVRQSNVTVTLTAPDGTVAYTETAARAPGTYAVPFPPPAAVPPPPPPGEPPPTLPPAPLPPRGTLDAHRDRDRRPGSQVHRGPPLRRQFLARLPQARAGAARPPHGGNASIRWTQTRAARVKVTVETIDGVLIRIPAHRAGRGRASRRSSGTAAGLRKARRRRPLRGPRRGDQRARYVALKQELVVRRVAGPHNSATNGASGTSRRVGVPPRRASLCCRRCYGDGCL